MKLSRAY